jgi:RNA polymerase sigma-70 factor, ECF subfamily
VTRELSRASLAVAAETTVTALAISGEDAAYDELVRRRQAQIRGLFRRLCRDAPLADDLAQQTFFQAWRRLGTLQVPAAFGGWLRKVAISIWLQHVRAHAGPAATRGRSSSHELDGVHQPTHEAADEPTIGERLDLDRALSELPPAVRLCVVLAYSEGMTHREISDTTDLPLGTVKSHIARGAARLRDLLRAYA